MLIIGISAYYHDAAACLIDDGVIFFAAQEERYTRIKNDSSFPINAVKNCLEFSKKTFADVDAIVYYEKPFLKLERILKTYIDFAPKGLSSFLQAMHVWTKDKLFIKQNIYKACKTIDKNFDKHKTKLYFSEHLLSHAASAFFPSPFQKAAILTIDGVGEYTTTSLAFGNKSKIEILKEIHFPHSIGLFYSAVTYYLGFKVNSDEYKVMGLAAYGNPDAPETLKYISLIEEKLIEFFQDGSYRLNMQHFSFPYGLTMVNDDDWKKIFGIAKRKTEEELTQAHCNLAYAFQKVTEKVVLALCTEIKTLTGAENLCLAGGVALNSVINGIITDLKIFNSVFIQPAGGDAGGALGAALAFFYLHLNADREIQFPDAMQNSLLGNTFKDAEVIEITKQHPDFYLCKDEEEVCTKTAKLIAEGKVIGWMQGRMEFGPRALGNRSILADARNENMQLYLNMKIKNRESFRPFAPAVLEEDANIYFDLNSTSPYMLQVHPLKKNQLKTIPVNYSQLDLKEKLYTVKSAIPAVTHVDFSARIQTVNKEQHPLFWKLINEFKTQTGCSLIVNTSFNVKDEPIVCTAEDAFTCFKQTQMDILVIGKYIFYK